MEQEQQFQEQLETIGKFKKSLVKGYEKLGAGGLTPVDAAKGYREDAEKVIAKVSALEGPLYTEEGKKAAIWEELEKLAVKHEEEFKNKIDDANETARNMVKEIDGELAKLEQLDSKDVQRIQLRYNELQAEIQSKLAVTKDSYNIHRYFDDLVQKSEYDSDLARFLSKYYYLFVERTREVEQNTNANVTPIIAGAEKAKRRGYTPKQLALMAMRKKMDGKFYSGSTRVLNNAIEGYKRKYRR